MDVNWQAQWGNYIVAHRTPAVWREYAEEAGRLLALNEWDEFIFYRDPSALSLTPKAVAEKAGKLAYEMVEDFRLFGIEMFRDYADQHYGTPAERKIWISEFINAYTKQMDAQVDALIPEKLSKNLDLFCTLLSWIRIDLDHGSGRAQDYNLRLAGKKAPEEPEKPEKPKYRPSRKELHDLAVRRGKRLIEDEWKKFLRRESDGAGFRTSMLHFGVSFGRGDDGWYVPDLDRDYFIEVMVETFQKELGKKALELAPATAWKNSYLICSLYEKLLAQGAQKKKGDEHYRGFWGKRNRSNYEQEREREAWKTSEREKIRKELEKEATKAAKSGKAKMSGPADREALVIVHLSSLDAFTAEDSEEGKLLGERLAMAILKHQGPIIIIDQGWETGYRESRPREEILRQIEGRDDLVANIAWIRFDEAEEDWDEFYPKLHQALEEAGATSAIIGGIWFNKSLSSGCATAVYKNLRKRMPTTVDEDLVGCEAQ